MFHWLKTDAIQFSAFLASPDSRPDEILSPLLVNLTLNGLETVTNSCNLIRYGGEFVLICDSPILFQRAKRAIKLFLNARGLEIHPDKSSVVKFGVNTPFDFLGYTYHECFHTKHVRLEGIISSTPKYDLKGKSRLYVYPSNASILEFKRNVKNYLKKSVNFTATKVIEHLNPMIQK